MDIITYKLIFFESVSHPKYHGADKLKERKSRERALKMLYKEDYCYILNHNAEGIIEETINGVVTRRIAPKDFLYEHYKIKRASEYVFKRLLNDIEQGLISFDELYKYYGI